MHHPLRLVCVLALLGGTSSVAAQEPPRVVPNDNRIAAGTERDGLLTLRFEATEAMWFPDHGPGERMYAFAVAGGAPRIPGPLVRVRTGTRVRALVTNTLPDTLRVHGLERRPYVSGTPLVVPPGETRETTFHSGAPGTYYYWGTTSGSDIRSRRGPETQLGGALVVDSADGAPTDRIFVITSWFEQADTLGPEPHVPRDMHAINGLSWPHTERFDFEVGDTVIWRWIAPTVDAHPMHLHGFYFDMLSRGTAAADTIYTPDHARRAVTETMFPGGTMTLRFVPDRPGNWLFHCHFAFHVSHFLSFAKIPDPVDALAPDAVDHTAHGMAGLVLAMTVHPRDGETVPTAADGEQAARAIRLHVTGARDSAGVRRRLGYVEETDVPPTADSITAVPRPLVLERDEPVRITIVNRVDFPTAVHWHGIEVEDSYADGVPGFSGTPSSVTPLIAPGETFVAAFTPPRAGTFMLHSHANEGAQIAAGLAAPLVVVDDRGTYDASAEAIVLITAAGEFAERAQINGGTGEPIRVAADRPTRLRVIAIDPNHRVDVIVIGEDSTVTWRALAKDGADLPPAQQKVGPARVLMGPGETWDFELPPPTGPLRLLVRGQVDDFEAEATLVPQ